MDLEFEDLVERAGQTVELTGIAVIVGGIAIALVAFGSRWLTGQRGGDVYGDARESIGRTILLGLELLVAGDIIRTVVVQHSLQSLTALAIIIALRTFLSLTLFLEVEGRWPWQKSPEDQATQRKA